MPKLPDKYKVEYTDGFGKKRRIYDLTEGGELLDLKIAKVHAETQVKKGAVEAKLLKVDGDIETIAMVCIRGNGNVISWKDLRK